MAAQGYRVRYVPANHRRSVWATVRYVNEDGSLEVVGEKGFAYITPDRIREERKPNE